MKYILSVFFLFCFSLYSQTYNISGKVTDEKGTPLIGVNVIIPNTGLGDATDTKGEYLILGLKKGKLSIEFSSIGYTSVRMEFEIAEENLRLDVMLPEEIIESEQVIISAGKHEQKISELPVSAEIISAERFAQKNFINLEDALRYVPGVNMTQDQISIRGSSGYSRGAGSRVLLAIDGIPYLTGDTGETIWEAIPTHALERVEIIKGAASTLYGSTALGGVINILTRSISTAPQTYFKAFVGTYDKPSHDEWDWSGEYRMFNGQTISHSNTFGKFGAAVSFTRLESAGYKQSGFHKKYIGYLKSSYQLSQTSSITLLANSLNKRSGNFIYWKDSRNALVPPDADQGQSVETNRYMAGLNFKSILSDNFYYDIKTSYYRTHWDDGASPNNESTANLFRGEVQTTYSLNSSAIIVSGIEGSASDVSSNIFGSPTASAFGVYSQIDYKFNFPLTATFGVRYDYNKLDTLSGASAFSPKLGLNYKYSDQLIFRGFIGTGFRAPSLAEAFTSTTASGITVKPNPNLKSEHNISTEAGVNYLLTKNISLDAAIFHSEYYDFIEPGIDPKDGLVIFDNLTRARIQGFEINSDYFFLDRKLNLNLNYTYMWARDIERNKFLKYRPRHLAGGGIEYKINNFQAGADVRYWSRVEEIDFELIDLGLVPDGDSRVEVFVVDLRGGYDFNIGELPLKIYLNINNLLNYNYVELIGNLEPIRNYTLSLEIIL
jgi:outer membrane receptor for ferrienterochelin and colicins